MPIEYYQHLRWAICILCVLLIRQNKKVMWWTVPTMVIFNPLFQLTFSRDSWRVIDIAIAVLFAASIPFCADGVFGRKKEVSCDTTDTDTTTPLNAAEQTDQAAQIGVMPSTGVDEIVPPSTAGHKPANPRSTYSVRQGGAILQIAANPDGSFPQDYAPSQEDSMKPAAKVRRLTPQRRRAVPRTAGQPRQALELLETLQRTQRSKEAAIRITQAIERRVARQKAEQAKAKDKER